MMSRLMLLATLVLVGSCQSATAPAPPRPNAEKAKGQCGSGTCVWHDATKIGADTLLDLTHIR